MSSGEPFYGKEGSLQLWPQGLYEMQFGANEQHGSTGTWENTVSSAHVQAKENSEDDSAGKEVTAQTWGPKFNSQNLL